MFYMFEDQNEFFLLEVQLSQLLEQSEYDGGILLFIFTDVVSFSRC